MKHAKYKPHTINPITWNKNVFELKQIITRKYNLQTWKLFGISIIDKGVEPQIYKELLCINKRFLKIIKNMNGQVTKWYPSANKQKRFLSSLLIRKIN